MHQWQPSWLLLKMFQPCSALLFPKLYQTRLISDVVIGSPVWVGPFSVWMEGRGSDPSAKVNIFELSDWSSSRPLTAGSSTPPPSLLPLRSCAQLINSVSTHTPSSSLCSLIRSLTRCSPTATQAPKTRRDNNTETHSRRCSVWLRLPRQPRQRKQTPRITLWVPAIFFFLFPISLEIMAYYHSIDSLLARPFVS